MKLAERGDGVLILSYVRGVDVGSLTETSARKGRRNNNTGPRKKTCIEDMTRDIHWKLNFCVCEGVVPTC